MCGWESDPACDRGVVASGQVEVLRKSPLPDARRSLLRVGVAVVGIPEGGLIKIG